MDSFTNGYLSLACRDWPKLAGLHLQRVVVVGEVEGSEEPEPEPSPGLDGERHARGMSIVGSHCCSCAQSLASGAPLVSWAVLPLWECTNHQGAAPALTSRAV